MADRKTLDGIIAYYRDALIIQYHNKPKARAMIELFVSEVLAGGIIFDVQDAYDIETAVGKQLDVIGKYVGIDRYFFGQEFDGYFAFTFYDEVTIPAEKRGFATYADYDTKEGRTLIYPDILSVGLSLTDEEFRLLIKMKIAQNYSNHSHADIDRITFDFFGDDLRPDSDGKMKMYYFIKPEAAKLARIAAQKEVLLRPIGVDLLYLVEQTSTFFGFATYDYQPEGTTGFSTYADYDTKIGETLKYDKLTSP